MFWQASFTMKCFDKLLSLWNILTSLYHYEMFWQASFTMKCFDKLLSLWNVFTSFFHYEMFWQASFTMKCFDKLLSLWNERRLPFHTHDFKCHNTHTLHFIKFLIYLIRIAVYINRYVVSVSQLREIYFACAFNRIDWYMGNFFSIFFYTPNRFSRSSLLLEIGISFAMW